MVVALVVPHTEKVAQSQYHMIPQLGVGYLAASLVAHGFRCIIVDAKMSRLRLEEVVERVLAAEPQVVGLSAMTHEVGRAHGIATAVKARSPSTWTFVGGCHASALPERTLREFPAFDGVVGGEAEQVFPEALERLADGGTEALAGLQGVAWRRTGEVVFNGPADMVAELDQLPMPAWQLFPETRIYPILTTRGCPFRCDFCQRASGGSVRLRPPDHVVDELKVLVSRFGARDVRFRDEVFTVNKKNAAEICERMMREGLHKQIRWSCITHCNTVDRETLAVLKQAGCRTVGFGVESGNPDVLKRMGKKATKDRVRKAIDDAKGVGLKTAAYYIFGHPYETRETVEDTIRFAAELNTTYVAFGTMVPYPGTKVYEMARRGEGGFHRLADSWADYDKYLTNPVELEGLKRQELERAQVRAYLVFFTGNVRVFSALRFFFVHRKPIMAMVWRRLRRLFRISPCNG